MSEIPVWKKRPKGYKYAPDRSLPKYWPGAEGAQERITELTDSHLSNCVLIMERYAILGAVETYKLFSQFLEGDWDPDSMAAMSFEENSESEKTAGWSTTELRLHSLMNEPLYRALYREATRRWLPLPPATEWGCYMDEAQKLFEQGRCLFDEPW